MKIRHYILDGLFLALVSLAVISVGLTDQVYIGHDTMFHISRIEGYARSIANGQWIPTIYPFKNEGFGYGSALFYCDFTLVLPALLYLNDIPLSTCVTIYLGMISFITGLTMMHCVRKLTKNPYTPYLATILYLFANYRLTNMYCRGAYGEVGAMMALPLVIEGLYMILVEHHTKNYAFALGLIGLIFTHNISFYLMMFVVVIMIIIYWCNHTLMLHKVLWLTLFKNLLLAFGVTMVFTFPMLEQITTTDYYLSYYGSTSELNDSALPLWSLFNPLTVTNGYGSNTMEYYQIMNTSLGLFTTLSPLYWFIFPTKSNPLMRFIKTITWIGYGALLLSTGLINLDLLPFLKIIQFAFRFNGIALVLLSISSAMVLANRWYSAKVLIPLMLILVICGIGHQIPYITEGMHMDSTMSYDQLIDGSWIDPYYGNSRYIRVEVAGADYLPIGGLNTTDRGHDVIMGDGTIITADNLVPYTFTIQENGIVHIPITYYKGYSICNVIDDQPSYCKPVDMDSYGMLSASLHEPGQYIVIYQATMIQRYSKIASLVTIIGFVGYTILKHIRRKSLKTLS